MTNLNNLRPTADRIIIRMDRRETVSRGGIIIPATASNPDHVRFGTVTPAMGPGRIGDNGERLPMGVKPGDRVLFSKHAISKTLDDGLVLVPEREIQAIIED